MSLLKLFHSTVILHINISLYEFKKKMEDITVPLKLKSIVTYLTLKYQWQFKILIEQRNNLKFDKYWEAKCLISYTIYILFNNMNFFMVNLNWNFNFRSLNVLSIFKHCIIKLRDKALGKFIHKTFRNLKALRHIILHTLYS